MWSACFTSCATGEKTQGISAEAQRRFDYYYAEAVKSKLAGRYDDSFELYKHCLDIKPDAAEALYNLGLYYLGMDDSARCASHLSRAVALEPDNIYYKEALASFYLRNRDDVKAVPVLEDMVRCNPTRSDVLAQLVNMYMDREQYREAISALDRIETLEGKNLSISMEKFRLYRELKEDDQAFAELESLARENPNDLAYRVLIGDQYLLLQQLLPFMRKSGKKSRETRLYACPCSIIISRRAKIRFIRPSWMQSYMEKRLTNGPGLCSCVTIS